MKQKAIKKVYNLVKEMTETLIIIISSKDMPQSNCHMM